MALMQATDQSDTERWNHELRMIWEYPAVKEAYEQYRAQCMVVDELWYEHGEAPVIGLATPELSQALTSACRQMDALYAAFQESLAAADLASAQDAQQERISTAIANSYY